MKTVCDINGSLNKSLEVIIMDTLKSVCCYVIYNYTQCAVIKMLFAMLRHLCTQNMLLSLN